MDSTIIRPDQIVQTNLSRTIHLEQYVQAKIRLRENSSNTICPNDNSSKQFVGE